MFFDQLGARPTAEAAAERRDRDAFDTYCDYLLVIDLDRSDEAPFVAGTNRLLHRSVAETNTGFCSAGEFDRGALLAKPGEVAELGRPCVHSDCRSGAVMQLLWRGIAEYLKIYDIAFMFGCSSLHGTDPDALMLALSYLHYFQLAPRDFRARAADHRRIAVDRIPLTRLDQTAARAMLPPLIKGYLRVGAFVGNGAVIDFGFNTTDVCIIVPTGRITGKYHRYYKPCGTP
ncbi:MAG: GNAT family N-acyltransferase [Rhodospirillaceae bacterium]